VSNLLRALAVVGLVACVGCAARTTAGTPTPPYSPPASSTSATYVNKDDPGAIPVDQEMNVRLRSSLSSETATVEQRFEMTTAVDLTPEKPGALAGSVVRVRFDSAEEVRKS
jgi:hypothetical protein